MHANKHTQTHTQTHTHADTQTHKNTEIGTSKLKHTIIPPVTCFQQPFVLY